MVGFPFLPNLYSINSNKKDKKYQLVISISPQILVVSFIICNIMANLGDYNGKSVCVCVFMLWRVHWENTILHIIL